MNARPVEERFHHGYLAFAAAITLAVLGARVWLAMHLASCGTPDSCSYFGLAETLASHQGFRQHYLVQYAGAPLVPYTYGIEYWRPGTSFLLLLAGFAGPLSVHGAVMVSILEGFCTAAVAGWLGWRATQDRATASFAYLLCLVSPAVWVGSGSPDSSQPYGLFVALFLLWFKVEGASLGQDLLALGCVAAVDLIRNDAILLLAPLVVVLAARRLRAPRGGTPALQSGLPYAGAIAALFLLALTPIHLLDKLVLGTAFPPGPSKALVLSDLSDLIAYGKPLSLKTLLAAGPVHLVLTRLVATVTIVYRQVLLLTGFGAVFLPVLFTRGRRPPGLLPLFLGGLAFYAAVVLMYGLVLPVVGVFSALRTFEGLIPLASVAIVLGVRYAVQACGAARAILMSMICLYTAYGFSAARAQQESLNAIAQHQRDVASYLQSVGIATTGSLLMTGDPAQFSVTTHYPAIPMPGNGVEAIYAAARQYRPTEVLFGEGALPVAEDELKQRLGATRVLHDSKTKLIVFVLGDAPAVPGQGEARCGS